MLKLYRILLAFSCAMFSLQAVNTKKRARTDSAEQQKTSMEFLWNSQAFEALKLKNSETFEKLKYALEQGANPNACDFFGTSLLSKAVMGRQQNAVELLLQHRASVSFVDKNAQKNSPLHWAAIQPDLSLMKLLVANDNNPDILNVPNVEGRTPLAIALVHVIAFNNSKMSSTITPEVADNKLSVVSQNKSTDIVGTSQQISAPQATPAVMPAGTACASVRSEAEIRQLVIDKFIQACREGRTEIIDRVLKQPALQSFANIFSGSKNTALHVAAHYGQLRVVEQLCKAGASLMVNNDGKTASDYAFEKGHIDIVDFLAHYQFKNIDASI